MSWLLHAGPEAGGDTDPHFSRAPHGPRDAPAPPVPIMPIATPRLARGGTGKPGSNPTGRSLGFLFPR